jgi:hypothetical protein
VNGVVRGEQNNITYLKQRKAPQQVVTHIYVYVGNASEMQKELHEKGPLAQLVKVFSASNDTGRFITAFTKTLHSTLS